MLNIGPQELIVVLLIALIVVGPSRLPELGRSIGKALREFRKVQDEVKDTFRVGMSDDPPARTPATRSETARTAGSDEEASPERPLAAAPDGEITEADSPPDGSTPEPSA